MTATTRITSTDMDLRCYFVTGSGKTPDIVDRAAAAARGGAGIIQVRSKPISARDLYQLTDAVADAVASTGMPTRVVVDDRVDVAAALMSAGSRVHGVHVGQDDVPVEAVRALLGPQAIIGLTTGSLELIREANNVADLIDYVGCGPFRDTPTKRSGRTPLGLEGYGPIVAESRVPVVAIGDVTLTDAAELAATGVAGLAVVRGFMHADDPEDFARQLVSGFDHGVRR